MFTFSAFFTCFLGSVCFGCKWFQEIIFRKIGYLVGFENRNFWKSFSFDRKKEVLTTEIHFRSYFHFKWFPERERERERKKRELRSHFRRHRRTPSSSPTIARTRSHRSRRSQHHADHTTLLDLASTRSRLRPRAFDPPIFDPSIFDPPISLSVWFWFLLLWWCGSGVLVVVAFDCRSLLLWVELEFRWCVMCGVRIWLWFVLWIVIWLWFWNFL